MPKIESYKNPALSTEERVEDLLKRMTIEEKLAQLGSLWVKHVFARGKIVKSRLKDHLKHGIGQINRPTGDTDVTLQQGAQATKDLQLFLTRQTRLGIPALIHEECLTGFMVYGATSFPQSIGLACAFKPETVFEMADTIRRQMRTLGVTQGLSPVLDVLRDPRWGRTEETYGEDPYLVASMGVAYIKGLQGPNTREGVNATPKHFAAHGVSEGGRNCAPVHAGPREMREIYLFPFEAAIKLAKARSLMNAYHEVDGVPCAANRELLTGILREEWGFDGYVVADYWSVKRIMIEHNAAASFKEAAVRALEAGIDIELPDVECYGGALLDALREGLVSQETVDRSVRRVLRAKFDAGLFEQPFVDPKSVPQVLDNPVARKLALRAARESIVLLRNEKALPLDKAIESLAVIGPLADSRRGLFGDYAFTAHLSENSGVATPTVLEAITKKVSKATVVRYAQGCRMSGLDMSGIGEAVEAAQQSEAVVVCVGERSGLWDADISGENRDRALLRLPEVQEELLAALAQTGKPLIVVLINGRPLAFPELIDQCAAIVEAWKPGQEGATAVADVLFGDANPGGKLAISFPRSAGHIPCHYSRKPSSLKSYVRTTTEPPSWEESKAIFPFGHGLSYASFRYAGLSIQPKTCGPAGQIGVSCKVTNTGKVSGDEVVQLYIHDVSASVSRPAKELKGFARLTLAPGETRTVTFRLSLDQLAFYDPQMRFVVEPGAFEAMIGASSEDIRLKGSFEVEGPTKIIMSERTFFSEAEVE